MLSNHMDALVMTHSSFCLWFKKLNLAPEWNIIYRSDVVATHTRFSLHQKSLIKLPVINRTKFLLEFFWNYTDTYWHSSAAFHMTILRIYFMWPQLLRNKKPKSPIELNFCMIVVTSSCLSCCIWTNTQNFFYIS